MAKMSCVCDVSRVPRGATAPEAKVGAPAAETSAGRTAAARVVSFMV